MALTPTEQAFLNERKDRQAELQKIVRDTARDERPLQKQLERHQAKIDEKKAEKKQARDAIRTIRQNADLSAVKKELASVSADITKLVRKSNQ